MRTGHFRVLSSIGFLYVGGNLTGRNNTIFIAALLLAPNAELTLMGSNNFGSKHIKRGRAMIIKP